MNGFISKPVSAEGLSRALLASIKPRQPSAPAAPTAVDHAVAPEPSLLAALRAVPGLQVDAALASTGISVHFYARLLRKFVVQHASALDKVAQALQADDPATAARLAHTLKGVAAGLGAPALEAAAGDLERCLKPLASRERVDDALAHARRLLQALVEALEAALAPA